MNAPNPPRWLENTLLFLLTDRDRETISGDLLETYRQQKLPSSGRIRAGLWYARQVVSFGPHRLANLPGTPRLLAAVSVFTAMSGCWLGAMGLLHRQPGYGQREIISATIAIQAMLTLVALLAGAKGNLRIIALGGSAGILYLGVGALVEVLTGASFEGYILLIALALILQAVLTVITLARSSRPPEVRNQPL